MKFIVIPSYLQIRYLPFLLLCRVMGRASSRLVSPDGFSDERHTDTLQDISGPYGVSVRSLEVPMTNILVPPHVQLRASLLLIFTHVLQVTTLSLSLLRLVLELTVPPHAPQQGLPRQMLLCILLVRVLQPPYLTVPVHQELQQYPLTRNALERYSDQRLLVEYVHVCETLVPAVNEVVVDGGAEDGGAEMLGELVRFDAGFCD